MDRLVKFILLVVCILFLIYFPWKGNTEYDIPDTDNNIPENFINNEYEEDYEDNQDNQDNQYNQDNQDNHDNREDSNEKFNYNSCYKKVTLKLVHLRISSWKPSMLF